MKTHTVLLGLAIISGNLMQLPAASASVAEAAEITQSIITSRAMREARQLLDDRDAMHVRARTAETLLSGAGVSAKALGFADLRETLQQRVAPGRGQAERLVAFRTHADSVNALVKQIEMEVKKGMRARGAEEIARYELLWAEVELARVEGRLPVSPDKVERDDAIGRIFCFSEVEMLAGRHASGRGVE